MPRTTDEELPQRPGPRRATSAGGSQSRSRRASDTPRLPAGATGSAGTVSRQALGADPGGAASLTAPASPLAVPQALAHRRDQLEVALELARVDVPLARQVDRR